MELLHFIRPWWLLAIIPLILLCILLFRQVANNSNWQKIVDPILLKHLLQQDTIRQARRWPVVALFLTGLLSILAIAGPAWERLPQPVFREDAALVLILDLSKSMDARDTSISRLERARFKTADILKQRSEGQTALIVYAADAFTVTPLTDDTNTIISQLPALTTGLMPAQGSNLPRALALATELLKQAGQSSGQVLLITDGVALPAAVDAAKTLRDNGYSLSIIGVGTTAGAPIPTNDGMLKDALGNIVIPRLHPQLLTTVALAGNGHYASMSIDDSDIQQLGINTFKGGTSQQQQDQTTDVWREVGPWLLLPVVLLASFAFRRGALLLMFIMVLPLPRPVHAFEWRDMWSTQNQQAQLLMQHQLPAQAAEKFADPDWKASAQYQAGDYQQALQHYQSQLGTEAKYNQGNSLARLGKFEQAIKAYDKVLETSPEHADAIYNRKLVKEQLKQQEQQQDQQQDKEQSDENSEQQESDEQSKPEDQQSDSQQDESSSSDESSAENNPGQDDEQSTEDQQKSDDEQTAEDEQSSEEDPSAEDQQQQADNEQESAESDPENAEAPEQASAEESLSPDEQQQATDQWLRRIPDDPSGLLRRKFKYQYSQRPGQKESAQPW